MSNAETPPNVVEQRFLNILKSHIQGWEAKIQNDFSAQNYQRELQNLKTDPVYSKFALDCPEYVLVRLIGRMSISVGRRLGEIYDKLPRFVASARFNITPEQVAEKFDGLELDIGLRFSSVSSNDENHVRTTLQKFGFSDSGTDGAGIEIRYNFNPNDSARLRKDISMVGHLKAANLFPIYLIYSAISPRDDAINRLTRAGWYFLQGEQASQFTSELFGIDFLKFMDEPEVKEEIHNEVQRVMKSIFTSEAFQNVEI
ncbi:hypothetical protein [Nostoc sp. UHCC 0252]|uniref:hypothetical protein n=1 Tax=Nostoc sp. UHCC 0252 TaxID=3110241 RepID=UPI002B20BCE4|nr:hypothetical protein [Nostoc sp. UHCC 0252]MEA5601972.1 hypothetical protein [Nostoc sp. UHCC 0252]